MRSISLVLIASVLLVIQSCVKYEPVELVSINDANLVSITPEKATFNLNATVNNPNAYNIDVMAKNMKVFLNNEFIGTADFKNKIHLEKNSSKKYTIHMESALPSDGNIDLGMITATSLMGGLKVKVVGELKATAKGISKTVPFEFEESVSL